MVSQGLTRYLTPVISLCFERLQQRFARRRGAPKVASAAH